MLGRQISPFPSSPDPLVQRCPDGVIFGLAVADTYDILPALAIVGVFDDPLHGCLRKATESTSMRFPRYGKIHTRKINMVHLKISGWLIGILPMVYEIIPT